MKTIAYQTYLLICLFFLVSLFYPTVSESTIYSYTDSNGVVHFTNVPTTSKYKPLSPTRKNRNPSSYSESAFDHYILEAAHHYNIDPSLIKAIIKQESDFNRFALSQKGAKGLMQLMPGTAQDMKVNNIYNPRDNIFGGSKYVKKLSKMFDGDIQLILASYNAGPERVRYTRTIPNIRETKHYVRTVMTYYRMYKNNI